MVGVVIVSHSNEIAQGTRALALVMGSEGQNVFAAGGLPDGGIGTDADRITQAIQSADQGDGIVVLADLGSAVLSTSMAMEILEGTVSEVRVADAPIVEGAVAAVVQASIGATLEEVVQAAEDARNLSKKID